MDSASKEFLQRDLSFMAVEPGDPAQLLPVPIPAPSRGGEPEMGEGEVLGRDENIGIGEGGTLRPPFEPFESSSCCVLLTLTGMCSKLDDTEKTTSRLRCPPRRVSNVRIRELRRILLASEQY
jgi:hypothetical protein